MATWSALYPLLLASVSGVSEPLADQALCNAAQEFFRRSLAWKQWLAPITLTTDTSYQLTIPTGSLIVRLEKATLNGTAISLPNWNSFDADLADNAAQGSGVTTADRISVELASSYAAGGVLKVQAVLTPALGAASLPDAQLAQHGAAIVEGAKARLMAIKGEEFTDLQLAALAMDLFEQAIGTAQYQAYKGFGREVPRMRLRDC